MKNNLHSSGRSRKCSRDGSGDTPLNPLTCGESANRGKLLRFNVLYVLFNATMQLLFWIQSIDSHGIFYLLPPLQNDLST